MEEWACVEWTMIEGVLVACSSGGTVKDETVQALREAIGDATIGGALVLSLGSARMSPFQRTHSGNRLRFLGFKSVILTDSRVTRGILTAISWFGGDIRSRPLRDLEGALDDLGLQGSRRGYVRSAALRLRQRIEHARPLPVR